MRGISPKDLSRAAAMERRAHGVLRAVAADLRVAPRELLAEIGRRGAANLVGAIPLPYFRDARRGEDATAELCAIRERLEEIRKADPDERARGLELRAEVQRLRRNLAEADCAYVTVRSELDLIARRMATWAAVRLDIAVPRVRWFEARSPEAERVWGRVWECDRDSIELNTCLLDGLAPEVANADQDPAEEHLAWVIFHECRHLVQPSGMPKPAAENDANSWANAALHDWR